MKKLRKFVISGGPSSGKSTAMSKIILFVSSLGYSVVSVPEVATELMSNGIVPAATIDARIFQDLVVKKQILNEKFFAHALECMWDKHDKSVNIMFCDCGLMDGLAYIDRQAFQQILAKNGFSLDSEFYNRYDHIIYLRTAPRKNYTIENNVARTETYEEACAMDDNTLEAWLGRPHVDIIDNNYDSFDDKIGAVIGVIARLLDVPEPLTIERKYLITDSMRHINGAIQVKIVQHYLNRDEGRIRAWTRDGRTTYFHTKKSNVPSIKRTKTECIITKDEYNKFLLDVDKGRRPIVKDRQYFVWKNQYFRLDIFHTETFLSILEVQPTTVQQNVILPDFLNVEREVTDDEQYYNYNIAMRLKEDADEKTDSV